MSKTTGALQDFYADQWDSPQFNPVLRDASVPSAKMSGSFEKSIKGATKIKNAPPKQKYVDSLLLATKSGEAGIGEVFRILQYRLRDSTWTVVFKSLMVTHLMVNDGAKDVALNYIARHRNVLAISNFTDAQTQGRNIRRYANYLTERAKGYRDTQVDWVSASSWNVERMTVDKGMLREIETMMNIIQALLKCDVLENEPETEITNAVFKLLVLDLLALFQMLNQALIKMLSAFFEMSKPDAQRALEIYRNFTKYTDYVVQYLSVARLHEHRTGVKVPKLKHAPVNLGRQLEDYVKDPDFDVHRRQYLAESDIKKKNPNKDFLDRPKPPEKSFPARTQSPANNNPFPQATNSTSAAPKSNKGPDPDLIDFFESIEQNQTPMQVAPQATSVPNMDMPFAQQNGMMFQPQQPQGIMPQQTGFPQFQQQQQPQQQPIQQQPTGMYMQQQQPQQQPQQLQPNFTGAGFGGYTPQPQSNNNNSMMGGFQPGALGSIPQNGTANFQSQPQQQQQQQPQTTNPFRQSMMMAQPTGMQFGANNNFTGFGGQQQQQQPQQQQQSTNPFARSSPQTLSPGPNPQSGGPFQQPQQQQQQQQQQPLIAQQTGTNPFARNAMPTQGQGMQQPQQPQQQGLAPQATGTTNPFRHGDFMNHNTGMGWQHNQMPIGGGLDQIQTMPVFPRPGQQTPWQQ